MVSLEETVRSVLARVVVGGERWRNGVAYNPLSAAMAQDPYPAYAALRARGGVHRSRLLNAWVIARHADADAILRDHRTFANDPRQGTLTRRQQAMLPPEDEFTMLFLDPPDHRRLRALVTKAFTSRAVGALEDRIRTIMAGLLDAIDDPGAFDLVTAVAQPLPIAVIAEMLGVPPEDGDRFKLWSAQRARLLEPTVTCRPLPQPVPSPSIQPRRKRTGPDSGSSASTVSLSISEAGTSPSSSFSSSPWASTRRTVSQPAPMRYSAARWPSCESPHGVGEDLPGAVPGLLQRRRDVQGIRMMVHGAVEGAGGAPRDGVLVLDADGLAVGVARSGALRPGLGPGDESAGLDEEVAGGRRGGGHDWLASGPGAAPARAMLRAWSNMATTLAWVSCSLRPM